MAAFPQAPLLEGGAAERRQGECVGKMCSLILGHAPFFGVFLSIWLQYTSFRNFFNSIEGGFHQCNPNVKYRLSRPLVRTRGAA